eukprot:122666_1
MSKSSMQDIDEEIDEEMDTDAHHVRMTSDASNSSSHIKNAIQSNLKSRGEDKKSMEYARLRTWTEAFVFKKVGHMNHNQLTEGQHKGHTLICEGCQTEIKLKDCKNNVAWTKYEAGESEHVSSPLNNTQKTFKKTFLFHDLYCETLRKYKEAIRQYAFEYEFANLYQTTPCNLRDPDRYIHLFAMKDDLLVVDSTLSRNANTEDKKPHKPSSNVEPHASLIESVLLSITDLIYCISFCLHLSSISFQNESECLFPVFCSNSFCLNASFSPFKDTM